MSSFEEASKVFENSFLKDDYFDSISAEFAKNASLSTVVDFINRNLSKAGLGEFVKSSQKSAEQIITERFASAKDVKDFNKKSNKENLKKEKKENLKKKDK